jgi:hypothetical protein
VNDVVAPLLTVCWVLGLMVPLVPAEGVTVQVWMFAEQLAVEPPFKPAQFQVHGPVPPTALAVPDVHRLVVGAAVKVPLLAEPHWPLTGAAVNVAVTVQLAVTGFVV